MEDYIYPILRYFFGNNNNKNELSDLEKSIDSPTYRDKYFNYNFYNENINNNYNYNNNQNASLNYNDNNDNNDNTYENIRNIRDNYGNDFVIMI